MNSILRQIGKDLPASIVVFLVAIPLCLGIALGSNAPLFSGIIAGIVGGIVVGSLSGSQLSVSGPAAGLTVIVASGIGALGGFESFLAAVVLAGVLQMVFGFIGAGIIGDYVPNAVIKGMLAAIGIILILKQLPHFVGYDADFEGDEAFRQPDQENTFSELFHSLGFLEPGAILIGMVAMAILLLWEWKPLKSRRFFQLVSGPLVAVVAGTALSQLLLVFHPSWQLESSHLVSLPVAGSFSAFLGFFQFPDWQSMGNGVVWTTALTLALVASLETLLSIEAVDKLDPYKRVTPTNRELKAQGLGNMVSGLLGGLPVTSVIVRSSANVQAGGQTKLSAILHGTFLFLSVLLIPGVLNKIPLSALAAILIFVGYKLAKVSLFREYWAKGWDQFIPFVVTIVAILFTDLLQGILIGILVGLFFLVRSNFRSALLVVNNDRHYLVRLRKDVSFLNKPFIKKQLESLPENSYVIIDATRADFIDQDVIDTVNEFLAHAHLKNIQTEIKKSLYKPMHLYFKQPGAQPGDLAGEKVLASH